MYLLNDMFDGQDMSTLIADTLKEKQIDYCYSTKTLNQVIDKCNDRKINFTYKTILDEYGDFDYYELHPVVFFHSDNYMPILNCNYQLNCEELPRGVGCKVGKYYYGIAKEPVEATHKAHYIDYHKDRQIKKNKKD